MDNRDNSSENRIYAKMHINPHFNRAKPARAVPHVNPNFYSKLYGSVETVSPATTNVHVNPKFMNVGKLYNSVQSYTQAGPSETSVGSTTLTALCSHSHSSSTSVTPSISSLVSSYAQQSKSKYKLVNVKKSAVNSRQEAPSTSNASLAALHNHPLNASTTPRVSSVAYVSRPPKSKYVLVRQNNTPSKPIKLVHKNTVRVSRYKTAILPVKTEVAAFRNKTIPAATHSESQWSQPRSSKNIKIDRRQKVTSKHKHVTIAPKKCYTANSCFGNLINIRGRKFSLTDTSLKLIGPKYDCSPLDAGGKLTVRVNGRTYVQKSHYLFVRKPSVTEDRESLKKNNIPCPLLRRFGECVRKEKGKCPLLHDKRHVAVCRKFLKGQCRDERCLLSHQATAEKMPTCSFYLQGCCTRENCCYLHVKVSDSAVVCADFLKGYCEHGDRCAKRHVYLCPHYAQSGECTRSKCPYPHRKLEYKITDAMVPGEVKTVAKESKVLKEVKKNIKVDETKVETRRYYARGDSVETASGSGANEIHTSRCRLGTLPSFIKLSSS